MSLEAEFSKLKNLAITKAGEESQAAANQLSPAPDSNVLGVSLEQAKTHIDVALRMNMLPAFLDAKYKEIEDAFGMAGIPIEKPSAFAAALAKRLAEAEGEGERVKEIAKIRENLGAVDPHNVVFGPHP